MSVLSQRIFSRPAASAASVALALSACAPVNQNGENLFSPKDARNLQSVFEDGARIQQNSSCTNRAGTFDQGDVKIAAINGELVGISRSKLASATPPENYVGPAAYGVFSSGSTALGYVSLKAFGKNEQGSEGFSVDTPDNAVSAILTFTDVKDGDVVHIGAGEDISAYTLKDPDGNGVVSVDVVGEKNFIEGLSIYAGNASIGLAADVTGKTLVQDCERGDPPEKEPEERSGDDNDGCGGCNGGSRGGEGAPSGPDGSDSDSNNAGNDSGNSPGGQDSNGQSGAGNEGSNEGSPSGPSGDEGQGNAIGFNTHYGYELLGPQVG